MTLSNPAAVQERLEEIETELAFQLNDLEDTALQWFRLKRDREKDRAIKYMERRGSGGTVDDAKMYALEETAGIGVEEEAKWEALKLFVKTLETRAAIGMSILRSQTRV